MLKETGSVTSRIFPVAIFDDTLTGNNLPNELRGIAGHDTLNGRGGQEPLFGGDGNDALLGGAGQDTLRGEDGDDTLIGGGARDVMNGGPGDDTLFGGGGNDFLADFDGGDDTFIGAAGDDTFEFFDFFGHKTITDFVAGADTPDRIHFGSGVFPTIDLVLDACAQVGNDIVITISSVDSLTLENVLLGSLHEDDFLII